MMALGGAMFTFDKLNRTVGSVGKVPLIAEMMPSKWAYEALMVNQFKNNKLAKDFYEVEKQESNADFKKVYYIPTMRERFQQVNENYTSKNDSIQHIVADNMQLITNEIAVQLKQIPTLKFSHIHDITSKKYNQTTALEISGFIDNIEKFYSNMFDQASHKREDYIAYLIAKGESHYSNLKNKYQNESLKEIVKNVYEKNKILVYNHRIIQQIDPIYQDPDPSNFIGIRSHFFSPSKIFMGISFDTYLFNMVIIIIMALVLYIPLYFELLSKAIESGETIVEYVKKIKMPKHSSDKPAPDVLEVKEGE